MHSRWTLVASLVLLTCLIGCGGSSGSNSNNSGSGNPPGTGSNSGGGASSPPEFLYASLPSSNSIAAFQIDTTTGALAQVAGSPFTSAKGTLGLAVHPSGKFLYAVNSTSPNAQADLGTVSAFTIASSGALTPDGTEVKTGSGIEPFAVALNPAGNFLYTVAEMSAVPAGYTVDSSTGQLTPMSSAHADFQDLFSAGGLVVTSAFVYESFLNGIDAFPIGANGVLTDTSSSPALSVGYGVGRMALGPESKFIYAIGTGQQLRPEPSLPGTLLSIAISSTGALSVIGTPLPFAEGSDVAVSGNFLFALNSQGVSVFAIDPNSGALTPVAGSPFALPNKSGYLQVDPSGRFLYVATSNFFSQPGGAGAIAAFSIDSSGALHPVTGSPFALPSANGGLASTALR